MGGSRSFRRKVAHGRGRLLGDIWATFGRATFRPSTTLIFGHLMWTQTDRKQPRNVDLVYGHPQSCSFRKQQG